MIKYYSKNIQGENSKFKSLKISKIKNFYVPEEFLNDTNSLFENLNIFNLKLENHFSNDNSNNKVFNFFELLSEFYKNSKIYLLDENNSKIYERKKAIYDKKENKIYISYIQFNREQKYSMFFLIIKEENKDLANILIKLINNERISYFLIPLLFVVKSLQIKKENFKLAKKIIIKSLKKSRIVYKPSKDLKLAHQIALNYFNKIFENILKKEKDILQIAYIKNMSINKGIKQHVKNNYWFACDIKRFFDNVTFENLLEHVPVFKKLNKETDNEILSLLKNALINPETKGLYQGFPLSGILANFVIRKPIKKLKQVLNKVGKTKKVKVSIYADDILISDIKPIKGSLIYNLLLNIFKEYNLKFTLNKEKNRWFFSHKRKNLGIAVNNKNQIIKPRSYIKKVKFKPIIEKLAHNKLSFNVLDKSLIGKLNECIRYETENNINGYLTRYVYKFGIDFVKKMKKKGLNIKIYTEEKQ